MRCNLGGGLHRPWSRILRLGGGFDEHLREPRWIFSPIDTAYIASAFGWTSALTLAAGVTVVSGLSWLAVDSTRGIGDLGA